MNGFQRIAARNKRERLWDAHVWGRHKAVTEGCQLCGYQVAEFIRIPDKPTIVKLFARAP